MERQIVCSSNIQSIGYDADSSTLEVEFQSGDVYQYTRVPASVHAALMKAPSKEPRFYTRRVKVERTEYSQSTFPPQQVASVSQSAFDVASPLTTQMQQKNPLTNSNGEVVIASCADVQDGRLDAGRPGAR